MVLLLCASVLPTIKHQRALTQTNKRGITCQVGRYGRGGGGSNGPGEGEVRGFVLIGRSKQIFMSGRLDDAFESARAPSGLRQVDSALGGLGGRGVSSDGGG